MNRRRQAVKEKQKEKRRNGHSGWSDIMNSVIKETTIEIEKRMKEERQSRLEKTLRTIDAKRDHSNK